MFKVLLVKHTVQLVFTKEQDKQNAVISHISEVGVFAFQSIPGLHKPLEFKTNFE